MKILIRGGSIEASFGVCRSYRHILKENFASRGISVINRSRAGENSFEGVETCHNAIGPECPDALIVLFGIDDAFSAVYRFEFKENLIRIIRMSRSDFKPRIFLLTFHIFAGGSVKGCLQFRS